MLHRASLLVLSSLPLFAQEAAKTLTLEQAVGRGESVSYARRAAPVTWAHTGAHVIVGSGDEAYWLDVKTLQKVEPVPEEEPEVLEAEEGEEKPEPKPAADVPPTTDEIAEALANMDWVDEDLAKKIAARSRGKSADGNTQVFLRDGRLFFYQRAKDQTYVGEVPQAEGPFELLDLSEEGGIAAWVKDNDLYLLDTKSGEITRVTSNGSEERFNGKLDWVYQEELYGRGNFKAFWIAPNGQNVAYLSLDESPVHSFTLVDHIESDTFRVKPEVTNYPKAGDPNPIPTLGLANTKTGATSWVDLSKYDGQEILIVRVGWFADGRCIFMVQDRIQTWCEVNLVDPKTPGKVTTIIREESETWTERPSMPRMVGEDAFLWISARTGKEHVYRYGVDGKLRNAVTEGDWSVRRLVDVDGEQLYFNASEGGATSTNLYRVNLDGTGFQRLTRGPGSHSVSFNADRSHLIDRVSGLDMPEEVRLCDGDGDLIMKLSEAGPSDAAKKGYLEAQWEVHEVAARDGFLLDATVLRPVPFDDSASYPVYVMTYSGPDAPSVRHRWNSRAFPQFLAQNGVIVFQVNVRSASGMGHDVIGTCYKQLGVQELEDLTDAVDWLCSNAWADGSRVGLTGYSYGGFMTAYAMLCTDKFALGIAGGGVFDWGMYDTIYTERYMSTPQLNPEGYEKTSCLKRAGDLSGFLHLHHGVMDDNVHVQNLMQFVYALQKAGKQNWSMMTYPQTRHGIRDRELRWHSQQIEWDLIREHLKPVTAPDRAAEAFDTALQGEEL